MDWSAINLHVRSRVFKMAGFGGLRRGWERGWKTGRWGRRGKRRYAELFQGGHTSRVLWQTRLSPFIIGLPHVCCVTRVSNGSQRLVGASRETGQSLSKRTYLGEFQSCSWKFPRSRLEICAFLSLPKRVLESLEDCESLPLIKAFQRQSGSTAPGFHSTQTRICEMIYECLV